MIPRLRPNLPPALANRLATATTDVHGQGGTAAAARAKWNGATTIKRDGKALLNEVSFRRSFCMYCYESRGTDIDHYRPIGVYPALTFDWDNHILACGFCNQTAKNEHFPLNAAGDPLLVNPFSEDPFHELRLLPASGEYAAVSDRGQETIDLLRLNDRVDLVVARARSWSMMKSVLKDYFLAVDFDEAEIEEHWQDLQCLPVADVLHHLVHYAELGQLEELQVEPALVERIEGILDDLRALFPACEWE